MEATIFKGNIGEAALGQSIFSMKGNTQTE